MSAQLLFLELNEVNFEYVDYYCRQGMLPNLAALLSRHGLSKTTSENKYEDLEPWIQWVTAHTGKAFAEHGVYRLGDIVEHDIPQIWELLEERGFRVGAVAPMNAKNRLRAPAFFVPDPWTPTHTAASPLLARLAQAMSQAVNDNAQSRITAESLFWLLAGMMGYARAQNYKDYFALALSARSHPWRKAMFLDLLLADIMIGLTRKTNPHFATLFLNAAAHIQHHYLFSSSSYEGRNRNPSWYLKDGLDPVGEVYKLYDRIVGQVRRAFPAARIMIATGLHQDPHGEVTYYWRLRDHGAFLNKIGASFRRIQPLMSRDFRVECADAAEAARAERCLKSATAADGLPLFEVDNRGCDLFVMLVYPREIGPNFVYRVADISFGDLALDVTFVAIKNGQHNGVGYFLDTGQSRDLSSDKLNEFPLCELPNRILQCFS